MSDAELQSVLRALEGSPGDAEALAHARTVLLRSDPENTVARGRLLALEVAQSPGGEVRRSTEDVQALVGGRVGKFLLDPDGRVLQFLQSDLDVQLETADAEELEDLEGEEEEYFHAKGWDWERGEQRFATGPLYFGFAMGAHVVYTPDRSFGLYCEALEMVGHREIVDLRGADRGRFMDGEWIRIDPVHAGAIVTLPGSERALPSGRVVDAFMVAFADRDRVELLQVDHSADGVTQGPVFEQRASALAFDPLGTKLAVADRVGAVVVRAVADGAELRQFEAPVDLTELRWAGDQWIGWGHGGLWVGSALGGGGRELIPEGGVLQVATSSDGRVAVTVGLGGLEVWDVEEGARLGVGTVLEVEPLALGLDPRGALVAVGADWTVRTWGW